MSGAIIIFIFVNNYSLGICLISSSIKSLKVVSLYFISSVASGELSMVGVI